MILCIWIPIIQIIFYSYCVNWLAIGEAGDAENLSVREGEFYRRMKEQKLQKHTRQEFRERKVD